jgi:lactoylglutathione lyase
MQLAYTILYVEDVPKSLAFYQQAFGLSQRFHHEAGDYGELETGTTRLAFSSRKLMRELDKNPVAANPNAPCFEIAFATDDVEAAIAQALSAGARLMQPTKQMPWGQTIAYVADLDGFLIELCTPMAS